MARDGLRNDALLGILLVATHFPVFPSPWHMRGRFVCALLGKGPTVVRIANPRYRTGTLQAKACRSADCQSALQDRDVAS